MIDVCFASSSAFEGCLSSCRNAATVLGGSWTAIPRDGRTAATVFDSNLLVLSSWDDHYETILAQRRAPTVLRWHSAILQTELSHESAKLAAVVGLLEREAIPALAVNDPQLAAVLCRDGVVHLPDVLAESEYQQVAPIGLRGVNVSLFGAPHWRKNLFAQSAGFDRIRRAAERGECTLHLNGQSLADRGYEEWLATTRIPYVDHGPLDRPSYLSLVASMDAGLCASLSESYGYVAADHVALGVPVVISPAVACLGPAPDGVPPGSVEALAQALSDALTDPAACVRSQRERLTVQARANASVAGAALTEIVQRVRSGRRG
ncbi:MAG TPA: hypothetical protein VMV46_13025 [Thermoanaerobaculia bacterium]|nr:hypothetical protein [Thermoanaerobaculia bacterium]